MPRFVNPYTPRSQIGEGLGNIMTAMFAGQNKPDNGRSALYPSEIALHEAQARAHVAKAALDEQTAKGRADLGGSLARIFGNAQASRTRPLEVGFANQPDSAGGLRVDPSMLDAMFPTDQSSVPLPPVQGYQLPPVDESPIVRAMQPPTDAPPTWNDSVTFAQKNPLDAGTAMQDMPAFDFSPPPAPNLSDSGKKLVEQLVMSMANDQPGLNMRERPQTTFPDVTIGHGAPGPISPEQQWLMDSGLLGALNLGSTSSNPNELAQALGHLQNQSNQRGFLAGDIKPSDLAVSLGKDIIGEGGGSLYDKFDIGVPPVGLPSAANDKAQWKETVVNGKRVWINMAAPNPTPSGIAAPEPTALINQFGGPVSAVDAQGNPVFIQPSHMGVQPKPVEGYFPPPTAAQVKRDEAMKAGQASYQAVDDTITEMQQIITDHPVSTATLLAPSARMWESVKGTGYAAAGKDLPTEQTPGIRIQSMKEGLLVQLGALKGRASNQDVQRVDRAIGLISTGTPANAIAGLELARELNAKYNRQSAQSAPSTSSVGTPPISRLKEGVATTFGNGQTWTLRNGHPQRLDQ